MVFRERPADFLRPKSSFKSDRLALLVGSWRYIRRRCATCGSGFEFSRSVIVREVEARKVRRKSTGSVVVHKFKIEECFPQKLCQ